MTHSPRPSLVKIIAIPVLISLVVTTLRVLGEVNQWSTRWFEPVTRGIFPSAVGWIFGITWLAVPFGAYFALTLSAIGEGPESRIKAVWGGVAGLSIGSLGVLFVAPWIAMRLEAGLLLYLIIVWAMMVIAALVHLKTWPALFKTLLVYGVASRIPVVVVYFLAMRGSWGTHYDYADVPMFQAMPLMERFLKTALFPQLIFWVAFTIVLGGLCGSIAVAIRKRPGSKSVPA